MHYAEFAEDEVSNFVRLTASLVQEDWLTDVTERSVAASDQRLREQQVEGNWTESGQAGEGMHDQYY